MELSLVKRSLAGFLLGAWVGFLYGVVSSNVNFVIIRDVPLRYDFNAMLASTGLSLLVGAILGVIVNLPHHSLPGVTLASLVAAIGVAVRGLLDTGYSSEKLFSTLFLTLYTFLPLIVIFIPFNALLRWSSQKILLRNNRPGWNWPGLTSLILWTFLSVVVGSFSLYPANALKMLQKMDGFIKTAQGDGSKSLPYEFSKVAPVVQTASAQYDLAWTDDTDVYPELLFFEDTLAMFRLNVVLAYFQSGETIFCLFREVDANLYLCTAGNSQP
jgi:hypothetical protein